MRLVTIEVDEWVLQEAAAALDTASVEETIKRALVVATEGARGDRLARRQVRLGSDRSRLRRRRR